MALFGVSVVSSQLQRLSARGALGIGTQCAVWGPWVSTQDCRCSFNTTSLTKFIFPAICVITIISLLVAKPRIQEVCVMWANWYANQINIVLNCTKQQWQMACYTHIKITFLLRSLLEFEGIRVKSVLRSVSYRVEAASSFRGFQYALHDKLLQNIMT